MAHLIYPRTFRFGFLLLALFFRVESVCIFFEKFHKENRYTTLGKTLQRQTNLPPNATNPSYPPLKNWPQFHRAAYKHKIMLNNFLLKAKVSRIPVINWRPTCNMVVWLLTLFCGKLNFVMLSYFALWNWTHMRWSRFQYKDRLKRAQVIPIYKKGCKHDVGN